jgi:hypothetical protein
MQLGQLSLDGRLLAGELTLPSHGSTLSVDLPSVGPCLLLLLVGSLLLRRELIVWLWFGSL